MKVFEGGEQNPPPHMGFQQERIAMERKDDLRRIKAFDQFVGKILEQVHYINKLRDEQKVAEVENIQQKIDKAARKLNEYMNRPESSLEENPNQAPGQSGDNIPIEKHPLLPDMGGMPLEMDNLDPAFLEELVGGNPPSDRAELQNQIKNKLQAKLKMVNKLQAEMKHKVKNQPGNKPLLKQANELVIKYKHAIQNLPPMLRPPEPEIKYQPSRPAPKPPGMS